MSEQHPLDPTVDQIPLQLGSASVLQALGADLPVLPHVRLRDLPDQTLTLTSSAGPERMPAPGELPDRYQLAGEIARGGMGCVIKCLDTDLCREIAVKVLLPTHAGRPEFVQRFVEEAQIAGQLQHPGIVPIYDMGSSPDKLPWFTMKLVEGQTLARLLAQRKNPAEDLPRFLDVFEKVCHTVAYAHAKGVIHRDLKPANVMVGAFGEVQVMDWGLAKVLIARKNPSPQPPPRNGEGEQDSPTLPLRFGEGAGGRGSSGAERDAGAHTQAGSILGTPAFMAPEQARGEVDLIDERTDVFGLGAILCVILTGHPPYHGTGVHHIHTQARQADQTAFLQRLDACGADPPLIALCRACLAANIAERPANAGAVAAAVAAHRASVDKRLHNAELDRAAAEARARGERKAQRLLAGLTAAVLGLVVLGVVAWRWWEGEQLARHTRLAQITHAVEADLAETEQLRAQAGRNPMLWAGALSAAHRAEGRLSGGQELADLSARVEKVLASMHQDQADRDMVAALERIRLLKIELKDDLLDPARAAPEYVSAFRGYGIDLSTLSIEEAAKRIQESGIRAELAIALDDWAERPGKELDPHRLRAIARQADPAPWRQRLRDGMARRDRAVLQQLAKEPEALEQPTPALYLLATGLARSGAETAAIDLLRRAQQRHPLDFWINFDLGRRLNEGGKPHPLEAARYFTVARALQPKAAAVHFSLGVVLIHSGAFEEGIASFHEVIRLKPDSAMVYYYLGRAEAMRQRPEAAVPWIREAIRRKPTYVEAHIGLGKVLSDSHHPAGARQAYQQALVLKPRSPVAHMNLGALLGSMGKTDEAIKHYRIAIREDPNLALVRSNLASTLEQQGKVGEAIAQARRAVELQPIAHTYRILGSCLMTKGILPEGLAALREAVRIAPADPESLFDLGRGLLKVKQFDSALAAFDEAMLRGKRDASTWFYRAEAYRGKGDLDRALPCCSQAKRLAPTSADVWMQLGNIMTATRRLDEGIAAYREVLKLAPKTGAAQLNLGIALTMKGLHEQAFAAFEQAVRLNPSDPAAHVYLGNACPPNKSQKAIDSFLEAIRLDNKHSGAWSVLATVFHNSGRLDEAAAAYEACCRLVPKEGGVWMNRGLCCQDLGDVNGAIASFGKVVQLQPTNATAWCLLGMFQQRKGRLKEGLIALRRGHAWGAGQPNWPYNSGAAVAEAERLVRLEPVLLEIVEGKRKPANAEQRFDFARLCQCKKYEAAAARLYQEAFNERPALAEEGGIRHRFLATRAAARAGCGEGRDADKVEDKERVRWRQQALAWVRADLALCSKHPGKELPNLRRWRCDPDLAGVRGKEALARLPQAERAEWQKVWTTVDALIKKAREGK